MLLSLVVVALATADDDAARGAVTCSDAWNVTLSGGWSCGLMIQLFQHKLKDRNVLVAANYVAQRYPTHCGACGLPLTAQYMIEPVGPRVACLADCLGPHADPAQRHCDGIQHKAGFDAQEVLLGHQLSLARKRATHKGNLRNWKEALQKALQPLPLASSHAHWAAALARLLLHRWRRRWLLSSLGRPLPLPLMALNLAKSSHFTHCAKLL